MVNTEELSYIGPPDTFLVTQDEKKIPCHKSILIQESHYFKAMFSPNFAEKDQKEIKIQVEKSLYYVYINTLFNIPLNYIIM